MSLLKKAIYKAELEIKKVTRRPFSKLLTPFESPDRKANIIHCCYHKVGTVWFCRILRDIAAEYGMTYDEGATYEQIHGFETNFDTDFFLDLGSHVNLNLLPNYVGSHMIRDPRDIVISGYFYHLWTSEEWANIARAEHRGMSYREYLNHVDQEEGIAAEIRRMSFWIPHMASWKYNNTKIYEIKYEDIMKDQESIFAKLFKHYGFSKRAITRCCEIADKYSFDKMAGKKKNKKKSHLRSGKCGEWRTYFSEKHKHLFKELYPGAMQVLGYEKGDKW
jgi:hypothetical protein